MDFDSLAFVQEGHFMSNKKCDLPKGSHRTAFKARYLTLPYGLTATRCSCN